MKVELITKNTVLKIMKKQFEDYLKNINNEIKRLKRRVLDLELRFTDAGRKKKQEAGK